jgi:hypothetical protein
LFVANQKAGEMLLNDLDRLKVWAVETFDRLLAQTPATPKTQATLHRALNGIKLTLQSPAQAMGAPMDRVDLNQRATSRLASPAVVQKGTSWAVRWQLELSQDVRTAMATVLKQFPWSQLELAETGRVSEDP